MPDNINAEIVAIGTEILLGEITDTNSVFIAKALRDIGINVFFMTSVGDNENRIANAIRIAMSRANVVITCGGLGPTIDDMTRQSVAKATDRGLTFHQPLLDAIAERFSGFRAQMTENNKRQAYLPDNATVIENPVGTAPSFIVEHNGHIVISLPGVPREMKFLMNERVIPYLKEHYNLGGGLIKAKILKTAGIGESLLDNEIGTTLLEMSNPTVGLAAHAGQVDVRITAKADTEAIADEMIASVELQIRQRVGKFIFGIDNDEIEDALVKLLAANGLTLAVSETGVGDPVGQHLKRVTGNEAVFIKQEIYDSPASVQRAIGLDTLPPIRELAEKVAETICQTNYASAGIAVISRPDMDDQHADSEGGTAIAVYTPNGTRSRVYGFGGQGETAATWVSTWAMSMLWQMLQEKIST
ncbi:MAG: CinA family nicotinamide mononucleotide deamidase-related protein [Anaerolineaceae bacterium]|nr:CinA family nicotinamide mononucleotide deamidase-related protein [Anaerolineaceae bacterium]